MRGRCSSWQELACCRNSTASGVDARDKKPPQGAPPLPACSWNRLMLSMVTAAAAKQERPRRQRHPDPGTSRFEDALKIEVALSTCSTRRRPFDRLFDEALRSWREQENDTTRSIGGNFRTFIATTTTLQQPLDVTCAVEILQSPLFKKTEYVREYPPAEAVGIKAFCNPRFATARGATAANNSADAG